jgi:hypothetical protein
VIAGRLAAVAAVTTVVTGLTSTLTAGLARAHGGLPVSQHIIRQGSTMYVPVLFWGIWVGDGQGPWTWICEEEINTNRPRHVAVSSDQTFYATDAHGITVSNDRGCTWTPFAGAPLAQLRTSDVVVDPSDATVAYVSTAEGAAVDADGAVTPAQNGLFVTHDHGATFSRLPGLDDVANTRLFSAVRVAPSDTKRLYVSSITGAPPFTPAVHVSTDGGQTFTLHAIPNQIDGVAPSSVELLAIDPRNPDVIYVRLYAVVGSGMTPRQSLLRSIDRGGTFTELWKMDGTITVSGQVYGIDGVAVDETRGQVLVATAKGMLAGVDPGGAPTVALQPVGNLTQAQCVDVKDGVVYACSSNYMPDFAALARSDDGGKTFTKILEYGDTKGPVEYCPKGTPVAELCPMYWYTYGSQLGIDVSTDGGIDGGTGPTPKGCQCEIGGRAPLGLGIALMTALIGLALGRRAARWR